MILEVMLVWSQILKLKLFIVPFIAIVTGLVDNNQIIAREGVPLYLLVVAGLLGVVAFYQAAVGFLVWEFAMGT